MSRIANVPTNIRNEIEIVLDRFDAVKVNKVMTLLEWKWANGSGYSIPEPYEIRALARDLMASAYYSSITEETGRGWCSSGGLVAECRSRIRFEGEPSVSFEIMFAAESAETWTP